MVSGLYLGFSIYRIKKLIAKKEDLVNTKIMTLHALSFGIYMLSNIVSVTVLGLYSWGHIPEGYYLASDIFTVVCSALTQEMMCYIFWNMENIKEPVEEINDEVHVEEVDQNDDL